MVLSTVVNVQDQMMIRTNSFALNEAIKMLLQTLITWTEDVNFNMNLENMVAHFKKKLLSTN